MADFPLSLDGIQLLFQLPDATPDIVNDLLKGVNWTPQEKRLIWDSLTPDQRSWLNS